MTTTSSGPTSAATPSGPEHEALTAAAVDLAHRWMAATTADETPAERRATGRLAALVADPVGLDLAVRFVDRVARPQDLRVAAHELADLGDRAADAAGFLGTADRALLAIGSRMAPVLPGVVVPPRGSGCASWSVTWSPTPDRAWPGTSPAPGRTASASTSTCSARRCSARTRPPAGCAASPSWSPGRTSTTCR
jgi:hypothetical protein